jgi:D-arabinose 1-dehydrogenase-like Zn-dependent alcohol dehydrogenase
MTISFTVFKGSPNGNIIEGTTTISELSSNDVLLDHTHSGVCGTDSHYRNVDMVLGHEGVGVVKAVGKDVKVFKL